jgi:hypothetical protein
MGKRMMAVAVALALGAAALVAIPRQGVAGPDPEPQLNPNQQYKIDPGPGWPAGWQEPPAPTEIPKAAQDVYADAQVVSAPENRPERLELRVMSPLPAWTKEYPYGWNYQSFQCGKTMYVYMFPFPDRHAIYEMTGDSYAVAWGPSGGPSCTFTPVTLISLNAKETPEQKEQRDLYELELPDSIRMAMGDLRDCNPEVLNGTYENIVVCFNDGKASEKFDVPAYLDPEVSRVRVPVRFISEMMGAMVDWDGDTETVTIHFAAVTREVVHPVSLPGYQPIDWWRVEGFGLNQQHFKWARHTVSQLERTIVLQVGKKVALVDGKEVPIDAPPVVLPPGRTMVPVRFIAEAMGAKVYWVGQEPIFRKSDGSLGGTNQVHIFTPFWPFFESPGWFLDTRAVKI